MAERGRVPLPFGEGMERDLGAMVVRPGQMEDLRNVYFRRGKLVVRKGLEQRLVFQDSAGNPATHVLAGQAISSERSAIAVSYEQANTGEVNVHRLDAKATVAERIGTWFTLPVGSEPPIVIADESYGRVFLAHDELRASQREDTVLYDSRRGSTLEDLEADLDGNGVAPIKFRGVVRHLAYIFGWGFGTASEDRPEIVRASLPTQPATFNPRHYWVVGDRRDPVVTVKRSGRSALVFKEGETHEIFGSGRSDFGQRPLDTLHGVLAPRLAVTVGDSVYGWSAEGPRRWRSGQEGSVDLGIPLELDGFEPSDLVARGDLREGFAHYVPAERVVIFVFGQRVYACSIRNPQSPEWTYWELGVTPFCAFTVPSLGAGVGAEDQSAPTGHPEFLDNIAPRNNDELRPEWKNVGQDGDEFVNVWTRRLQNIAQDWPLFEDADIDGVADGWTETDDPNLTTAFSIDQEAQKIAVTASAGAGFSYIERQDITEEPIVAGEDYEVSVALEVANMVATAKARMVLRWFDNGPAQIGADIVVDDTLTPAEFERALAQVENAPAGAVRLDVLVGFRADAAGDTGEVWFRDVSVDKVADRGAWTEYGSFLVQTTATQDERLTGFAVGSFHQIALRYKRSVFVTAGYEGDDPSTWPLESRGLGTTGVLEVEAPEIAQTYYTVNRDATTGEYRLSIDLDVQISQQTYDAFQQAESSDFTWRLQVFRKIPAYDDGQGNVVNESAFQKVLEANSEPGGKGIEDFSTDYGDPVGMRLVDFTDLLDYFDAGTEEFEYFARVIMESNVGSTQVDSPTIQRWPGRYDPPFDIREDEPSSWPPPQFDANLEGGTVQIALQGTYPADYDQEVHRGAVAEDYDDITTLVPNQPPKANAQGFTPYVRVQWRNVTDATGWADLGAVGSNGGWGRVNMDKGSTANFTVYLDGLLSGKTYEFRIKTHVELSLDEFVRDRRFESDWSEVLSYTAP